MKFLFLLLISCNGYYGYQSRTYIKENPERKNLVIFVVNIVFFFFVNFY